MTFQSNPSITPVATIRQSFSLAEAKLLAVDKRHLERTKYAPTWARLSSDYDKTLSSSQDLAADIAAYYDQYNDAILKIARDPTIAVASKKKTIQRYISKTHKFNVVSKDIASSLEQLSQGLNAIKLEFQNLLRQQELELVQLRTDIKTFETTINDFDAQIKTAKSDPEPVGGGLFKYLWRIWMYGLGRKVNSDYLREQRSATMEEKLASEEKKTRLEFALTPLFDVNNVIENVCEGFSGAIQDALKLFHTAWFDVNDHCQKLLSQLDSSPSAEDTATDPLVVSAWLDKLRSYNRGQA